MALMSFLHGDVRFALTLFYVKSVLARARWPGANCVFLDIIQKRLFPSYNTFYIWADDVFILLRGYNTDSECRSCARGFPDARRIFLVIRTLYIMNKGGGV